MHRLVLCLLFLLGNTAALVAQQTAKELEAFHPAVKSYELLPGVLATPKFRTDDHICEMALQKRLVSRNGIQLDGYMPEGLVDMVVDMATGRGGNMKGYRDKGVITLAGDAKTTTFKLDDFSVEVTERNKNPQGGPTLVVVKWTNWPCSKEPEKDRKQFRAPFELLPGYRMTAGWGIEDGPYGKVWKDGGPTIEYSFDMLGTSDVDSIDKDQEVWREEQTSGINHFVCVFTRSQELVVTLTGPTLANFRAKIRNQRELAEVLLIVLSVDRSSGYPVDPSKVDIIPRK